VRPPLKLVGLDYHVHPSNGHRRLKIDGRSQGHKLFVNLKCKLSSNPYVRSEAVYHADYLSQRSPCRSENKSKDAERILCQRLQYGQRKGDGFSRSSLRTSYAVLTCEVAAINGAARSQRDGKDKMDVPSRMGGIQATWTSVGVGMAIAPSARTRKLPTPRLEKLEAIMI
jgi:hypothetical protein